MVKGLNSITDSEKDISNRENSEKKDQGGHGDGNVQ